MTGAGAERVTTTELDQRRLRILHDQSLPGPQPLTPAKEPSG